MEIMRTEIAAGISSVHFTRESNRYEVTDHQPVTSNSLFRQPRVGMNSKNKGDTLWKKESKIDPRPAHEIERLKCSNGKIKLLSRYKDKQY